MSIADLSEIKLDESNIVSANESLANIITQQYGSQFGSNNAHADRTDKILCKNNFVGNFEQTGK